MLSYETLDDPAEHDLHNVARRIRCPIMIVFGSEDYGACEGGSEIARGVENATVRTVAGGNHVFNTINPALAGTPWSDQLRALLHAMVLFTRRVCENKSTT